MLSVKHYTIPIFIPELACPFQCVFCNQQKISGHIEIPSDNDIINIIESHLRTFKKNERNVEVGFFGGSFTGIDINQQKHFLKLVQPYLLQGHVNGIRISTRPDYISEEILKVLGDYNVTTIELGAQSFDNDVLMTSKRGHTAEQTINASLAIKNHGFKLGLQMMIGLPGDTLEKSINTAKKIIELGASCTRIYPVVVIKDTMLNSWYNTGRFLPLSLEEAVIWSTHILKIFKNTDVNVIRVGLHPSEGLLNGDEIVDGPFHPSFKELVFTELWKERIEYLIDNHEHNSLEIRVNPSQLNHAIGYNSTNKNLLAKRFRKVKFVSDSSIGLDCFKIR